MFSALRFILSESQANRVQTPKASDVFAIPRPFLILAWLNAKFNFFLAFIQGHVLSFLKIPVPNWPRSLKFSCPSNCSQEHIISPHRPFPLSSLYAFFYASSHPHLWTDDPRLLCLILPFVTKDYSFLFSSRFFHSPNSWPPFSFSLFTIRVDICLTLIGKCFHPPLVLYSKQRIRMQVVHITRTTIFSSL